MSLHDEVESFLNKARLLIFAESEKPIKSIKNIALIQFIYSDEDIEFFKADAIHKSYHQFFDNERFTFIFHIKNNTVYKMSIVNVNTANSIILYNTMHETFYTFIELVDPKEEIILNLLFSDRLGFSPHQVALESNPVTIYGYSIVYE